MKKKKIVHVTSSLKMGGAETVLFNVIAHMPEYEHEVIYVHDGPFVQKMREKGVLLHKVSGLVSAYDPLFFMRVARLVKKIQPCMIHSLLWLGNLAGIIASRATGIPIVSTFHNNVDQNGFVRNAIDTCIIPGATHLVAVSNQVKHSVEKQHTALQKEIVVIPNGIDCDDVRINAKKNKHTRSDLDIPENAFIFGSVGRFEKVKRYDYLIEIFARVYKKNTNAFLILVGIGSQLDYLRECAQQSEAANNIRFIVGQTALGYYPLFDCFVQSTAKEGVSMALLEAMCVRVPCVINNDSYEHEVIKHEKNGIIVPSNDADLFENALLDALCEPEKMQSYAHNAYQTVQNQFAIQSMIKKYQHIFSQYRFDS